MPEESPGTVLVTGGASGLGAAVVRAVRDTGGTPVVVDLRTPSSEDVHFELVDLADGRAAETAVQALAAVDAELSRPEDVAAAVLFALRQPPGTEIRELIVTPSTEPSWP